MHPILLAVLLLAGLGLLCGLILAVASMLLAVPKNELEEKIRAALPGANCGGCGYSGCDGYAAALARREAPVGRCTPGGEESLAAVSALLGVDGALERRVAAVRCGGCDEKASRAFTYTGQKSCRAAMQLFGGDKGCRFGCLGYGDCARVCEYGAIALENGIARIDPSLCRGCGKCADACPKDLIALTAPAAALVQCRSTEAAPAQRKLCTAGCIGCGKCARVCPQKAITVENKLAVADEALCTGCGQCAETCPVGCIRILPEG